MNSISSGAISNGAIALAYLVIPLTLLPLLRTAQREIWLNLLLAIAFVSSCSVGHILTAIHLHSAPWHWITAIVSWAAVVVLLMSQNRLRTVGESFRLLEATWEESVTGKILFEHADNDLVVLKINPAGAAVTQNLLQLGDRLCEKMPTHREQVYPYAVPLIELYLQALSSGKPKQLEFQYKGEISGWYLTVATPISSNLLYLNFSDITNILHDPLTGVYNRRILEMDLDSWHTCFYIDLDRFKLINDQRGQQIGDQILIAVANVIQSLAQQHEGIVIRDGGDEFMLLLPKEILDEAREIAIMILQDILAVVVKNTSVSASIGIASGNISAFEGATHLSQLIQAAETAMREAKRNRYSGLPQNRVRLWDEDLAQQRLRQNIVEAYLQQRSTEAEFWLAYQPICHMGTGNIIGAEALIRWDSAQLGMVSPDEFIPIAESTGLVHRISDWVLCNALEQLSQWHQIVPTFSLSINISPVELEDDAFIERIVQRVSEAGIACEFFGLEITERGIYRNLGRYLKSLEALRAMSIRLKVDDFGTGQSGLAQLLQFRFDEVKVDRRFIPINADSLEQIAICEAIAKLSAGIKFDLVAEGIEYDRQRELMLSMNYCYGQGYLFARPMAAAELTAILQAGTRL